MNISVKEIIIPARGIADPDKQPDLLETPTFLRRAKTKEQVEKIIKESALSRQEKLCKRAKKITSALFKGIKITEFAELGIHISKKQTGTALLECLDSAEKVKKIFLWQTEQNGDDFSKTTKDWPEPVVTFLCDNLDGVPEESEDEKQWETKQRKRLEEWFLETKKVAEVKKL